LAGASAKWIKPQLTRLVQEAPAGSIWLHEVKYDGCPNGVTMMKRLLLVLFAVIMVPLQGLAQGAVLQGGSWTAGPGLSGRSTTIWRGILTRGDTSGTSPLDTGTTLVSPYAFGAECNGTTVDSTAFTSAFAAGKLVHLPPNVVCVVGDLLLGGPNATLDCNGSTLQAAPGSLWTIKKTGVNVWIRNCVINDPSFFNVVTTTTSGALAAGAATFNVGSAAGFQTGMPVNILLTSGAYWPMKIKPVGGIAGNSVTIVDPIPSSATGVALGSGGVGCRVGDSLVVQGGSGPPVTLQVTGATAGAVTSIAIASPGFYSATPSNPAVARSQRQQSCTGVMVNLIYAGASASAAFYGSWGSVVIDQTSYGGLENITIPAAVAGIGIYSTSSNSLNWTAQENYRSIEMNATKFFGILVDAGVHIVSIRDVLMYGYQNAASSYGTVGFSRNYVQPTNSAPSGGNRFSNVTSLGFEIGAIATISGLDSYEGFTTDTTRNYGFLCNGCNENTWPSIPFMTFTGPDAGPPMSTAGYGIGMYFGKYTPQGAVSPAPAINNGMAGIRGGFNGADIYFSDWYGDGSGTGASMWIGVGSTIPTATFSGHTAAVVSARDILLGNSGASVGGTGATVYMANGVGSSADEFAVVVPVSAPRMITRFTCQSSSAPGPSETYSCNLREQAATVASCTISGGSSFGCTFTGPAYMLAEGTSTAVQLVSSPGAAASFFRIAVSGM